MASKDYKRIVSLHLGAVAAQAERQGISTKDIAESTGFTHSNVTRMLRGKYVPRYDNMLKLLDSVNLSITIKSK